MFNSFILDEGRSIYDKKVFPLFQEAHINVKTIYTERANHARDYINENSFDEYDGLISVGGVMECFQNYVIVFY